MDERDGAMTQPLRIIPAEDAHLAAIVEIYNHAVHHTTSIWNDAPVDQANRRAWLSQRRAAGYPVLVALDEAEAVLGYASFGDFRPFDGYRHTVELSVYVRHDMHRRGIGRRLLAALIDEARARGKHVMVAAIESGKVHVVARPTAVFQKEKLAQVDAEAIAKSFEQHRGQRFAGRHGRPETREVEFPFRHRVRQQHRVMSRHREEQRGTVTLDDLVHRRCRDRAGPQDRGRANRQGKVHAVSQAIGEEQLRDAEAPVLFMDAEDAPGVPIGTHRHVVLQMHAAFRLAGAAR